MGLDPYYNVSGSDIRIVDVRPIVDRPGLTVIGVLVAGLAREEGGGGATYRQFPPSGLGDLWPAVGFVLPANTPRDGLGYNFVIGYRTSGVAVASVKAVEIDYEVSGVTYSVTDPAQLIVCAPPTTPDQCRARGQS